MYGLLLYKQGVRPLVLGYRMAPRQSEGLSYFMGIIAAHQ